jgi:hypothetical protein
MKLKLKTDYLFHSIGGGGRRAVKLSDISPEDYIKYYNLGYTEFFEVVEDKKKPVKNDDKNNKGNESISLPDTDREDDIN